MKLSYMGGVSSYVVYSITYVCIVGQALGCSHMLFTPCLQAEGDDYDFEANLTLMKL